MSQKHILIVDDEKNILTSLKDALELEDFRCSVAGSCEIAGEKIEREAPDLVLLDLILPGMSGIEFLRILKKQHPNLPVIMMSGHASISDALEAVKIGAHDFLEKPISSEKTVLTIRNTLQMRELRESRKVLQATMDEKYRIIGESASLIAALEKADKAASSRSRILITGESGTGKELVAGRVHSKSARAHKPFVKVNCAAIPAELIESELFGHKKGSFTGAIADRQGKFRKADGGTIFLDEIGDMTLKMQAKLLRVLQEEEFEPIGSEKTVHVDVRVISATNKNLEIEIEKGNFRKDLFYRLNVVPITIPPLRERKEDIPLLVTHFLKLASEENNRKIKEISPDVLHILKKQRWPGNIRQLKNICEKILILSKDTVIGVEDLELIEESSEGGFGKDIIKDGMSLKDMTGEAERRIILHFLKENNRNMAATARALQLERSHLYKKCKSLGIET